MNGLPTFSEPAPATLIAARPAARDQAFVDVVPPEGFADAYTRPGQFCKIRLGEVEGIFAMFSAPRVQPVRFLVRVGNPEGGEAADLLASMPDGASIEMSMPAGNGFPLERARGRDIYFVATGTGIAPVRAAIETVLEDRASYAALSLDHGVRSEEHLAVRDDIARWRAAGLSVHVHFSTPLPGGVRGTTVQEAIRERHRSLADAAVVAVGQDDMLDALREVFLELGGDPALFLKNV